MAKTRNEKRQKRKYHIRKRIFGTSSVPRVNVFRSNRYVYVQAVDDETGKAVCALSTKKLIGKKGEKPVQECLRLGNEFAILLKKKKIKEAVFDRAGYKYHGRVKAVAEGIREGKVKL